MTFQQTPYTELLLFSAVVSGTVCAYALQRYRTATRNADSLVYFAVLMAAAAGWSTSYALGISEVEFQAKVLWLSVTNLFTTIAPTAWLAFTLTYTDNDHYLTRRTWAALAVEPLVVVGALLAGQRTELYYYDLGISTAPGFRLVSRELGPLFVLHAAYSYALVVVGAIIILQFVRLEDETYRGQAVLLVGGALLPVLSNALFVLDVLGTGLNLTSVFLGGSGLAFALAISRYRFFELAPVARDTVVERMRDGYLVCDETGTIVDSNAAASDLLGVSDDLLGEQLASVAPELDEVVAESTADADARDELVREHGPERRYVDVTVSTLPDVGGTLVVLRDVTDERRAERRFQTLIEGSSDIITVFDADGVVEYVSPSVERVLGIPPDAIVGLHVSETIHPADRDAVLAAFQRALDREGFGNRVEYRVRDGDGDWRYLEAAGRNFLDDPSVEGIVVNARDVTERKRREQRLEETMTDLERTNDRLERFASVVSHDLRNPLNVADGYAELLEDRVDDPAVGEIRTSHERMRRIIDDVLALARDDDDVTDLAPVSLEALAVDAWDVVETKTATLDVDDGTVAADRSRLARAFENLFRNSVEHGGDDVTVAVGPLPDADGFYVADDGPGLPDDVVDTLFEEGVSGDGGTGLGLAIVDDIVDAHGWTVHAVADADGARFEVRSSDRPVLGDDD